MAMIDAGRLADARAIWQRAMQTQRAFRRAAIQPGRGGEAMGDRRAAEVHYNAARQLAPSGTALRERAEAVREAQTSVTLRPRPAWR